MSIYQQHEPTYDEIYSQAYRTLRELETSLKFWDERQSIFDTRIGIYTQPNWLPAEEQAAQDYCKGKDWHFVLEVESRQLCWVSKRRNPAIVREGAK